MSIGNQTRGSATAEIARDAIQGHSRSSDIVPLDFLLAFNSNLNRSWDITPTSLHIHNPPLFQVELEKDGCE